MQKRTAGLALLLGASYYGAGVLGLSLTFVNESVSPVWPPTGVAIAGLALLGLRYWPIITLGAFLFNLGSTPPGPSAMIALGNTAEALVGAWILLKLGLERTFTKAPATFAFAAGAGLAAPAISATVGVGTLLLWGFAPWVAAPSIWATWWLGDAAGAIVLAPAIVLSFKPLGRISLAGGIGIAATVLAAGLVFGVPELPSIALVVVFVPLAYVIMREGPLAAAWSIVGLSAAAVVGTLQGHGPFFQGRPNEALLILQLFTATGSVTALALSAGRFAMQAVDVDGQTSWGARWLPVSVALLPLIIATVLAGGVLQDARDATTDARREAYIEDVANRWETAWASQEEALFGLEGLFTAGPVDRASFRSYVEGSQWLEDSAAAAVSFNRVVHEDDVAAFEVQRQQEFPDFAVHPDTGATWRYVVDYLEPLEPNRAALGLDLGFNETRRVAVLQALETDEVVTSGPIDLVQGGTGVLSLLAVPDSDGSIGLVTAVVDIAVMAETLESAGAPHVGVYPGGINGPAVGNVTTGTWSTVDVPGGQWLLRIPDPPGLTTAGEDLTPWAVMATGGMLGLAFAGIAYAYDSTRLRAHDIAKRMTRTRHEADKQRAEAEHLQEMDRMKSDFINMAAHELRTPLVPLRAQLAILRLQADDRLRPSIAIMQRNVDRLGSLVEDVLGASRAQAGRVPVDIQEADPHAVARAVLDDYTAAADERNITLELICQGGGMVGLDLARMSQVASNLVGNALKFTPDGGTIRIRSSMGEQWTFEVSDDGMGMDPGVISQLFQPFVQVHDPGAIKEAGSGLGLYVCRAIVEAHEGTIEAHSDGPGKGSRFTVTIS